METNNDFDYNAYINEQMVLIKKEREDIVKEKKFIQK